MSEKMRTNRITAWLLTIAMLVTVLSGFSITAFAAETVSGTCGENLTWTLDDEGTLTISGTGAMADYGWKENLPPWADYKIETIVIESGVKTIGDYAFYGCESLTSVTIPEGVETIGEAAFGNCSSLTLATIPESVKTIGEAAFIYDINLTSVTIPEGVKTIEAHTFHCCSNLSSVTIPEGVENIKNSAFSTCKSLASITIPESVELIGDYAFYNCESLESVIIPEGVKTIGEAAFVYCGSLTSVTIPESVESIGTYAFYGCESLASVTVPRGVKTIGDEAFYDCRSLASVTLSENVETIGDNVFFGCERLLAIEVSKDNPVYTSIDGILFSKDRKTLIRYPSGKDASEYVIPDETVAVADTAFLGCKNLLAIRASEDNANYLSIDGVLFSKDKKTLIRCPAGKDALEYAVPDGTVTISENAFSDCNSITSITIPESVTTIGDEAFDDCKNLLAIEVSEDNANYSSVDGVLFSKDVKTLIKCPAGKTSEFIIPDGAVTIAGYAFENCKELTAVTIPSSVKAIAEFAFYECSSLTSVDISEGVETIGSQTFYGCTGLETVTIPSSVKFIGDCAFSDCNDIIVYIKSKEPAALGMLPFHDPTDATNITASKIIVPPDSVDAYIDEWYKYEDIIEPESDEFENPFTDVNTSDWYYEDVIYAVKNGLFNGTSETTFAPNTPLTRAMLVTVLYRAEGEPRVSGITSFSDLEKGQYYLDAVCWAQVNGIVNGVSEIEFAPNDNITREQIAAIMHRYAQYKGYDVSVGENTNILSYDDFDSISEYAIASMQYAVGSGLMKGKTTSTLGPLDNATRAECAAILHRFIEADK